MTFKWIVIDEVSFNCQELKMLCNVDYTKVQAFKLYNMRLIRYIGNQLLMKITDNLLP